MAGRIEALPEDPARRVTINNPQIRLPTGAATPGEYRKAPEEMDQLAEAKNRIKPENFSPLDRISTVLMGSPGTEAVMGLAMPPYISLFEAKACDECSVTEAWQEHHRAQGILRSHGINVVNMRAVLGEELVKRRNDADYFTKDQLLSELRSRAIRLYNHYKMGQVEKINRELEELLDLDIQVMGLDAALAINGVLTNCIEINGQKKKFDLSKPSAANFMFWRDGMHTTGGEIGLHVMHHPIRQQEVILTRMGLEALGLDYEQMHLKNPGESIEGGDVLPMEINGIRYALIGRAERTTDEGVEAWYKLHENLWSQSGEGIVPVVVEMMEKPPGGTQNQMHIDTWAQQFAKYGIIFCEEIADNRLASELYRDRNGKIQKRQSIVFSDWVRNRFPNEGIRVLSVHEQLNYAPNILVDGGVVVYNTRPCPPEPNHNGNGHQKESVVEFMRRHGVVVYDFNMQNLTDLYGGFHCGTNEFRIRRK